MDRAARGRSLHEACVRCTAVVTQGDKAFQCDFCDKWEHISCAKLAEQLYEAVVSHPTCRVLLVCTPCEAKRRRQRSCGRRSISHLIPSSRPDTLQATSLDRSAKRAHPELDPPTPTAPPKANPRKRRKQPVQHDPPNCPTAQTA